VGGLKPPVSTAPAVRFDDPAREDCTIRGQALPSDFEAELVEPAERGQVRAGEGSVRHVEVLQMGSVRTPILGRWVYERRRVARPMKHPRLLTVSNGH
jgi:hypothetical protein